MTIAMGIVIVCSCLPNELFSSGDLDDGLFWPQ